MFCMFVCIHNVTLADSCGLICGIYRHNLLDNKHNLYKGTYEILNKM